jgi:UDP-N-acetylmuramyl pentapeptide phosphotransferase/UDP-N-acetylglucosamine-1-phosphate transferase
LLPSVEALFLFAVAFVVPCAVIFASMPRYMRFLTSKGRLATDVHKPQGNRVPSPAGPLLILAIVAGEAAIYAINESSIPIATICVVLVAGAVGLYDDLRGLGGVVKPLLLTLAAVPLILLENVNQSLYTAQLYFPLVGATGTHYIIFAILIIASMPIASNAFNMLDAFNGELSGFTVIASIGLIIAIVFRAAYTPSFNYTRLAAVLPLAATALCFYYYNRYPARIFDGDSGSLTFGALFATLAIIGGVEVAALVAVIPAVLNSYYILSSIRGFVEHKQMAARPTYLAEEGKLHASASPGAPTTLVRMILMREPMGERELVRCILTLAVYACVLSVLTSAMTWPL